jgi:hypothetical protein
MPTSTHVLIIAIAIAAIVILIALGTVLVKKSFVLLISGREHRQVGACTIGETTRQETRQVTEREVLAAETATRARGDIQAA